VNDVFVEVRGLHTHFFTDEGVVRAVNGVDFSIQKGRTVCLVGESGCGKSVTARSILQIVDAPGRIVSGQVLLNKDGRLVDLAALDPRGDDIRAIRGREIAMIFQEPMSSLSALHTIGDQITEAIQLHTPMSDADAAARAVQLLQHVGIPKAETRLDTYPFQLSGGMRQRAMIAMALSCNPGLLIADEPTTALDVTTQATILDLIQGLQAEYGMAVLFITHDLGVVAEIADDVVVMYLGQVAESGPVDAIFHEPKHPYTQALLESIPRLATQRIPRLASIRGMVPHPFRRPAGCPFHPRCEKAIAGACNVLDPPVETVGAGHNVRCLLHSDVAALAAARPAGPAPAAEPATPAAGQGRGAR
jgi:peptide/nickel transport system ATP-binding protein